MITFRWKYRLTSTSQSQSYIYEVGYLKVKLYLEVTPEADFDLDDIIMEVNIIIVDNCHHKHHDIIIIFIIINKGVSRWLALVSVIMLYLNVKIIVVDIAFIIAFFHQMSQVVDAGDWESEANERIDQLRRRDVNIEV